HLESLAVEKQDLAAAPERYKERPSVPVEETRIGLRRKMDSLPGLARREVDRRQRLTQRIDDEELLSVGGNGEPPQETILECGAQRDLASSSPATLIPRQLLDRVFSARRLIDPVTRRRPCKARPRIFELDRRLDLKPVKIDDRDRRLAVASVD